MLSVGVLEAVPPVNQNMTVLVKDLVIMDFIPDVMEHFEQKSDTVWLRFKWITQAAGERRSQGQQPGDESGIY